jgi:ligand-binding sensor domain-containing protein/AraC-like DNA-binding protein
LKSAAICFIILYPGEITGEIKGRNRMKRRKNFASTEQILSLIILVHLFWLPAWGLDPDKPVNQYLVDKWETADGIPSNTIHSIVQTPDGYLWIATSKGLVRFDGIKFSIIPFAKKVKIKPLKTITPGALLVDRAGILWIGSTGVLTSYDFQTDQFKNFTSTDGLTKDLIRRIKDDMNGNLWISFFSSYVNRFSHGKFTAFNESHGLGGKKVNAIVEDEKGNLLFVSRENGVFKYRDGKFFKYFISGLDNHLINTMHEDRKGDLWIATNKGLFRVTANSTIKYTTADGLSDDYITDIKEDSGYNIWAATLKGLNRIKRKEDGTISTESLLQSFLITCLFEDREKNLWLGTMNWGIKKLKDGKFISYAPLEAYQGEIPLSVFEDRGGDTWIGTLSGKLFRCRGSDIIESLNPPKLSGTGIFAITDDAAGNLWLGTNGKGILQLKQDAFIRFSKREGLADDTVTSIYKDSRDNLWFSTSDGVSIRYKNGVIKSFTSRDGLSGKTVHNVYEDKNKNIWIAADRGITVFKDSKIEKQNMQIYLPGISVPCIYEEPSPPGGKVRTYWIATHGAGLKRLSFKDSADGANGTIISYTTDNGMTTNSIFQFFEDKRENFWLMSDSGILRVSKVELERFARGDPDKINCISYGISDGMRSEEFNNRLSRHSALKTRKYEFWFVTTKGISIVDPEKIRINKTLPPVVIEAFFSDRQSIPLHRKTEPYAFKGITDFSFHFTALTFLLPEKIKFKYRLEGLEKEWIFLPPGRERAAHYQNLAPGTYTFRVIACNSEGIWNQTGDSINFTVKAFFYQTLVFKIVIFFLFTALLAAVVYIYKKRPFEKKIRYKDSPLNPHFAEACIKKLNHLMENEKVHLDENISLQALAEKISIPPHQLSQLLNDKLNQNFSDFINYHRIEEAKEILKGPRGVNRKNTAVAYDVGFNSMTAFYKAFKKFAGMTPNQYKKEIKKKKKSTA